MASTYSSLKFELIGTGEQSGTWGNTTNTNLGTAIEEAITGSADVTFASAAVTLTLTNTNASQTARNLRLNLIGTSGGAQNLVVPDIEKFYLVNNACADAITVKNSTGATVAVPASKAMLLFSTGSGVVDAVTHMSSLTLTTALAVAQGGTGATTAADARTNLGLGTIATASADAYVSKTSATGSGVLPSGTEAQRDGSPAAGYIRFNSDSGSFEGYDGSAWGSIGGGASAGGAIYENVDNITANYTITTGSNGISVGPMTIDAGVTVTVPSGQRWVIL